MTFFASASAAARFPPFTDGAVPYYRYKFTPTDRYFRPFREDFSQKGHLLMNTTLNIVLAGLGTVGGGLVRLLSETPKKSGPAPAATLI